MHICNNNNKTAGHEYEPGEGRNGKINNLFKEDEVPGGGGGSSL